MNLQPQWLPGDRGGRWITRKLMMGMMEMFITLSSYFKHVPLIVHQSDMSKARERNIMGKEKEKWGGK